MKTVEPPQEGNCEFCLEHTLIVDLEGSGNFFPHIVYICEKCLTRVLDLFDKDKNDGT